MGQELSPPTAGFTLIEVAVAVALLSVLSVGSVLALRGDAADGASADRSALMAAHAALRHEAILADRPLALWIGATGWQVQDWNAEAVAGGDTASAAAAGPPAPVAGWIDRGSPTPWRSAPLFDGGATVLRIVFLPTGQATPLALRLGDGTRCGAAEWGALACPP